MSVHWSEQHLQHRQKYAFLVVTPLWSYLTGNKITNTKNKTITSINTINNAMAANSKSKQKLGFSENFLLSGIAAAVSKTSAAPIERIKLLLQNQGELLKQGRLDRSYRGVKDCVVRTYTREGLSSFWRGNMASVIRYFPQQALNFAFKVRYREYRLDQIWSYIFYKSFCTQRI